MSEDVPEAIAAPATTLAYPWKHYIGRHMGRLGTRNNVVVHQRYVSDVVGNVRLPWPRSTRLRTSRSTATTPGPASTPNSAPPTDPPPCNAVATCGSCRPAAPDSLMERDTAGSTRNEAPVPVPRPDPPRNPAVDGQYRRPRLPRAAEGAAGRSRLHRWPCSLRRDVRVLHTAVSVGARCRCRGRQGGKRETRCPLVQCATATLA